MTRNLYQYKLLVALKITHNMDRVIVFGRKFAGVEREKKRFPTLDEMRKVI